MEITCNLTGKTGKPVRAHIIPKAFYGGLDPNNPPLIMPSNLVDRPERTRTGVWDDEILTAEGEHITQELDDYAAKILIEEIDEFVVEAVHEGLPLLKVLHDYDYKKLKLFFLSLIWRASVSKRKEFQLVNLGPHEHIIRDMIMRNDPGGAEEYSVCLFKFIEDTHKSILFPAREKFDGINYYRFIMAGYIVLIKIDNQSSRDPLKHIQISPDKPLLVVMREFKGSPEMKLASDIAMLNNPRLPNWFKKSGLKA